MAFDTKVENSSSSTSSAHSSVAAVAHSPFNSISDADLIIRSFDNVEFRILKSIVVQASPKFRKMLLLNQVEASKAHSAVQCIAVPEDHVVIDVILRICYPMPNPRLSSFDIEKVLKAGKKYKMDVVVEFCRQGISDLTVTDPLKAYGLACRCGLIAEAATAAERTLHYPMDAQLLAHRDGCHSVSGVALSQLLLFHESNRTAALRVIGSWKYYAGEPDDPIKGWSWSYSNEQANHMQRVHGNSSPRISPLTSDPMFAHLRSCQPWFLDYMESLIAKFNKQPRSDKTLEVEIGRFLKAFCAGPQFMCTCSRSRSDAKNNLPGPEYHRFPKELWTKIWDAQSKVRSLQ